MTANIPNDLANDTSADAVPLQQNLAYIEHYLNTEVITRDGAVAMTGPLTLAGAPTQAMHPATKQYVDAIMPVGVMMPYLGEVAPAGWLLCQGQTLSTSAEPALFAVLGYRYGGSGSNFQLPDMRHRFPIGKDATIAELDATGNEGGTTTVPLPQHAHTIAHAHEHPHTHPIDHDHANFSAPVAVEVTTAVRDNSTAGDTNSFMSASGAGSSDTTDTNPIVDATASVNVPAFIGTSGDASEETTGGSSAANSGNAGVAGATMRPEFVVVNYIIKVVGV